MAGKKKKFGNGEEIKWVGSEAPGGLDKIHSNHYLTTSTQYG